MTYYYSMEIIIFKIIFDAIFRNKITFLTKINLILANFNSQNICIISKITKN